MNDYGRRYLIEQLHKHDNRRGDARRNDRRNSDYDDNSMYDDYEDRIDNRDSMDYYDEMDSRRGVRGSGRGGGRGRDNADNRDYGDYNDYHKSEMRLRKSDITRWKQNMQNTDGTRGEHYDMQQVMQAAEKLGVRFKEYDEKEFCVAVNMFYSDYGHIIKRLAGGDKEKELLICADFAKAFFDDPDGPEPSEKLAITYHCLTDLGQL